MYKLGDTDMCKCDVEDVNCGCVDGGECNCVITENEIIINPNQINPVRTLSHVINNELPEEIDDDVNYDDPKNPNPYDDEEYKTFDPVEDEGTPMMNATQLGQVNTNTEKHKTFMKQQEIDTLKMALNTVQTQLIEARLDLLKKDKSNLEFISKANYQEYQQFSDESRKLLLSIASVYPELDGKQWGYDPESGAIVANE